MELSEKWLGEIGGWQVLKQAHVIADRGAVGDVHQDGDTLRAEVAEGQRRYQSGLKIKSRSDVENLCTCPTSRGRGMICAHSLAVALVKMRSERQGGVVRAATASAAMNTDARPSTLAGLGNSGTSRSVVAETGKNVHAPLPAGGRFTVFLSEPILEGQLRGQAGVFLKFETGEGTESDTAIAAWLRTQGLKPATMPLVLMRPDLLSLLRVLPGHERIFHGKPSANASPSMENQVTIAAETMRLPVQATETSDGDVSFSLLSQNLRTLLIDRGTTARNTVVQVMQLWFYAPETRSLFNIRTASSEVAQLLESLADSIKCERSVSWMVQHRDALDAVFQLSLSGQRLAALHLQPLPCEFALELDGSMQAVEAKLYAVHEDQRWLALSGSYQEVNGLRFPLAAKHSNTCFYARNMGKETAAVQRLEDLSFSIASATSWRLQGADKIARFYASELPRLEKIFTVKQSERWRGATRGLLRISPKALDQKSFTPTGKDWLSLEIAYTASDGFRISRTEILQMIRSGRRSINRDGKQYLIDEEAVEEFEECLRDADSQLRTDGVLVKPEKAQFLLGLDDAQWAERQQASWQSEAFVTERLPDLAVLLRPYQMHGIRWLEHMASTTGAALLADDMGLGKTLQAIALMRLVPTNSEQPTPHLVICPKTLIPNWQAELQRFAPEYKVLALQGAERRADFAQVSEYDIVITTYQLIARDIDFYQDQPFASLVLDEASYIRNPDTAAAKALRSLQAQRRIALTGTPLENGVRDLWSIYQFLLPGYLGSRDNFRDRFEKPLATGIQNAGSRKVAERLRKLVRPYFLRRTKQEVLQDLPEKIEQVLWCELSKTQTEVYRRLLEEGQAEVQAARKRSGQGGAKMAMFTVLLRLRQVCCDLRMAGVDEKALKGVREDELSGKISMWRDRLTEIMSTGGKVIVFSQFVKFLSLLRANLEAEKIDYCYLDGQSNDRGEQVERFQKEASVRVFLVSLKAGGYGLNLTAADHVMLMDPWWNPAVEAQAIDRAHRFGQERVVTALRLVTRGTVEEKILKLQATKRGIIEAALEDNAPLMNGLTEGDLEQMLG